MAFNRFLVGVAVRKNSLDRLDVMIKNKGKIKFIRRVLLFLNFSKNGENSFLGFLTYIRE
jgi:hypothetical protein